MALHENSLPTPDATHPQSANGHPTPGALYVAVRVSEREQAAGPSVTRTCARCDEPVLVDADALTLAESCAAIVCSCCTDTPDGILYIPSPGWK